MWNFVLRQWHTDVSNEPPESIFKLEKWYHRSVYLTWYPKWTSVKLLRRTVTHKHTHTHKVIRYGLSAYNSYSSYNIHSFKMPTRCNRGFHCRSYCLLNMFRAPLCPSSGAQEYYTVVGACGISCCGFQVAVLVWSWSNILQTGHITPSSTPDQQLENHSTKYHRQQPLYNILELLMMGIVVAKHVEQSIRSSIKTSVASSWHFISTYSYRLLTDLLIS